jgi:hypothetical protein
MTVSAMCKSKQYLKCFENWARIQAKMYKEWKKTSLKAQKQGHKNKEFQRDLI